MKKTLLLFAVAGGIFLSGCTNTDSETPVVPTPSQGEASQPDNAQIRPEDRAIPMNIETLSTTTWNQKLPGGTFYLAKSGMPFGDFYVNGYAEAKTLPDPFCAEEPCEEKNIVFFNVTETGSQPFRDFLHMMHGDAEAGPTKIILGCQEDDIVRYQNDSDATGMTEYTLDGSLTEAILASNETATLNLHLIKLPLNEGKDTTACYSHFRDVMLVTEDEAAELSEEDMIPSSETPSVMGDELSADSQTTLLSVESAEVLLLESYPVQARVVISGNLRNGCEQLDKTLYAQQGNMFLIALTTKSEGDMCTQALIPFRHAVDLPIEGLLAGEYTVKINNNVKTSFTLKQDN